MLNRKKIDDTKLSSNISEIRDIPSDIIGVSSGKYSQYSVWNITGFSANIPTTALANGQYKIIHEGTISGLDITLPTTTEKLSFASTNANDNISGTGARLLLVQGLDTNKEEITDFVALNGTTPVLSNLDFLRVNRMIVLTAGTSEYNEGEICCSSENETWSAGSPTTTLYRDIATTFGWDNTGVYTTPLDITNTSIGNVTISSNTSANKEAEIHVESRRHDTGTGTSWLKTGDIPLSSGTASFPIRGSGVYTPGTDITVRAIADGMNTKSNIYFLLYNYREKK